MKPLLLRISGYLPLAIVLLLLIYFHTRGVVFTDEGYILHSAERMTQGQIPYRDFHFTYTPGVISFIAFAFLILGKSIFAERVAMICVSFITVVTLYKIGKLLTKNSYLIYGGIALYIFWGPAHTNFAWPVMFCITTIFLTIYFHFLSITKKEMRYFLLAGVCSAMLFVFKQNFFPVTLAALVYSFITDTSMRKRVYILPFVAGIGLIGALFIFSLILTKSLYPFVTDMYVFSLKRIAFGDISTPFLYGEGIKRLGKGMFYLLPLLIIIFSGIQTYRFERKYTFISVALALFYCFEIRPTTDYIHLTPIFAVLGLPLILIYLYTKQARRIIVFVISLMILIGVFSALGRNYYGGEKPLIRQNTYYAYPKARIWTMTDRIMVTDRLRTTIDKRTTSDYIFINEYEPMVYFLTGKKNPSEHDLVTINDFYKQFEPDVIRSLNEKHVNVIITLNKTPSSFLGRYIPKNFTVTDIVGGYYIWVKNSIK